MYYVNLWDGFDDSKEETKEPSKIFGNPVGRILWDGIFYQKNQSENFGATRH